MSARKLFWLLASLLTLLFVALLAGTWIMTNVVKNKSSQLVANRATIAQLSQEQTGLTASKADVAKYDELQKIAQAVVPQDKDQAQTVLQINNIAAADGITLTSITFPGSSLGGTGSSSAQNLSQLTPVKGIQGVYNLQLTISNDTTTAVSFNQLDKFLQDLENNRRTAQVASINIQPQQTNAKLLTFSLVINTYIKP